MSVIEGLEEGFLDSVVPNREVATDVPDLSILRCTQPTEAREYTQSPGICLVLRGAKEIWVGEQHHDLAREQIICYPVQIPMVARISSASRQVPYVGLTLGLDYRLINQAVTEMPEDLAPVWREAKQVGTLTPALSDAFKRMVQLLSAPEDVPVLGPLIKQEIYYRLLRSPQGEVLRGLVSDDHHVRLVLQSISWMKQDLSQPMHMGELASRLGMSESSFYRSFRRLTSMSPLQYQKSLRLTEARRLVRQHADSISAVSRQVGYESPSQFSREYKRLFSVTPREDWGASSDGTRADDVR